MIATYTIPLPWTNPPLSLNDRQHWRVKARKVAEVRQTGMLLVRQAKVPACTSVHVVLHYQPRDQRRRDAINVTLTQKAMVDGVVDAGVVPDDCAPYLTEDMPVLHPAIPGEPGALWLTLTAHE